MKVDSKLSVQQLKAHIQIMNPASGHTGFITIKLFHLPNTAYSYGMGHWPWTKINTSNYNRVSKYKYAKLMSHKFTCILAITSAYSQKKKATCQQLHYATGENMWNWLKCWSSFRHLHVFTYCILHTFTTESIFCDCLINWQ